MKNRTYIFILALPLTFLFSPYAFAYNCEYYQWPQRDCVLENSSGMERQVSRFEENQKIEPMQLQLKDIHFDFDEASLKNEAKAKLNRAAKKYHRSQATELEVIGHTDSIGDEKYNQKLSKERAKAVKAYLVTKGISPQQIQIVAEGESNPISTNNTEEGRAENRRADVVIDSTK